MFDKKIIAIINGANLDMLGDREPEIYGSETLDEIVSSLKKKAESHNSRVVHTQSNYEGDIINKINLSFLKDVEGIIINPGAWTHSSYAIADALKNFKRKGPVFEVHLSNINEREDFRKINVLTGISDQIFCGKQSESYHEALDSMINILKNKQI